MSEHAVSRTSYLVIFVALMAGTYLTVQMAFIDLGWLNPVLALTIALVKATLVVLYFMHIRYSTRLTRVVVVSGLFWLLILFTLTMSDYLSRDWNRWVRPFVDAGPVS